MPRVTHLHGALEGAGSLLGAWGLGLRIWGGALSQACPLQLLRSGPQSEHFRVSMQVSSGLGAPS